MDPARSDQVFRVHPQGAQFLGNLPDFLSLSLGSPFCGLSGLRFSLSAISVGLILREPQVAMPIIETQIGVIRDQQAVQVPTP